MSGHCGHGTAAGACRPVCPLCAASSVACAQPLVSLQELAAACRLWLPCSLWSPCLRLSAGTGVGGAGPPRPGPAVARPRILWDCTGCQHLHSVGLYWLPFPAAMCLPGCSAGKGVRAWVTLSDGQQWHATSTASSDAAPSSPTRRLQKARQVRVTMGNKQMMRGEDIAISQAVDDYMREMEVGTRVLAGLTHDAPAACCGSTCCMRDVMTAAVTTVCGCLALLQRHPAACCSLKAPKCPWLWL